MEITLKDSDSEFLFKAILSLETVEECCGFFEDLCTYNELSAMKQRFSVAASLNSGATQTEIREKTGASSATISRVNRTLRHGNGAYSLLLTRIKKNESG